MKNVINDYRDFSHKLILTTCFTVLLSAGISSFLLGVVGSFAPLFPSWAFSLGQVIAASAGLWWMTKNGEQKKVIT